MSTERIIVSNVVLQKFASKLGEIAHTIPVTAGASMAQVSKVASLVADAVSKGAEFLCGNSLSLKGSHIEPVVLTKVTRDMDIWYTETFAPVCLLIGFDTLDEAVILANDGQYGLSSSLFSANISQALELAQRLKSGAVHINSMTIHDESQLPHGGTKGSGWGRFGVPWGKTGQLTRFCKSIQC